jgi:hypothetical protein
MNTLYFCISSRALHLLDPSKWHVVRSRTAVLVIPISIIVHNLLQNRILLAVCWHGLNYILNLFSTFLKVEPRQMKKCKFTQACPPKLMGSYVASVKWLWAKYSGPASRLQPLSSASSGGEKMVMVQHLGTCTLENSEDVHIGVSLAALY